MASISKRGRTFRVRWIDHEGQRHSATFTSQREALEFVRRREVEVDDIKRGIKTPVVLNTSVGEALDYWCLQRAPAKRSCRDDLSIIKAHLKPAFGHLLLRHLSVSHTDAYIKDRTQTLNPKTVANHLTLLVSVMNAAVDLGWLDKVPNIKKPHVVLFPDDYRFLRTDEEIESFLMSALSEGKLVHTFYKTALCTGLRAGELGGLRRDDVDFANRLIRVQRSFHGPTKSGKVRYVPILDVLYDDLLAWTKDASGVLFPNRAEQMHSPSSRIYQEVLHRVLKRANFPTRTVKGVERPYIVFHDLRHTFASQWVMKGGDIFKLQKILGHQSIQMTMRYAHFAPHAFSEDLGRFGSSQSGLGANIIPLTRSSSKKI